MQLTHSATSSPPRRHAKAGLPERPSVQAGCRSGRASPSESEPRDFPRTVRPRHGKPCRYGSNASRRQARAGFSLMEVTIAVAIIAFTCIPLIAMLPVGMKTMRDGQREAVGAEIVRLLANELSMSNWGDTRDLKSWEDELRHFDGEGIPLKEDDHAVFTAKIEVGDDTTLPGAPAKNRFLKRVTIKVTHKPKVLDDRFTNPKFHRTYSMLIAKMDK